MALCAICGKELGKFPAFVIKREGGGEVFFCKRAHYHTFLYIARRRWEIHEDHLTLQ